MTDVATPASPREPEGLRSRTIWLVGSTVVAVVLALTGVAWLLVEPPAASPGAAARSPLEHGLIEQSSGGRDARIDGERALARYEWVDRGAGLVRIPIAQAIEAVVANPALIAQPEPAR